MSAQRSAHPGSVLDQRSSSAVEVITQRPPAAAEALPDLADVEIPSSPAELEALVGEPEDDVELVLPAQESSAGPVTDLVRLYLREIGRIKLLTAEDEVRLARSIEAGLFAEERLCAAQRAGEGETDPFLRRDLQTIVREGQRSKEHLVAANLRLVVSVAKRYAGRGLPLLDLIQEGNLGLIRAVEKFDYARGYKFSTYASWWIRQSVSRALADQGRTIRVPVHMAESINRVLRAQRTLAQELGREPTPEEIGAHVQVTPERVVEALRTAVEPISLHLAVGEDGGSELGDLIEDCEAAAPIDAVCAGLLTDHLEAVLQCLGERERAVVRLRYGLADGEVHTLEEVGRQFGVTRERVRQIEAKTLAKLRQPTYALQLRDYL